MDSCCAHHRSWLLWELGYPQYFKFPEQRVWLIWHLYGKQTGLYKFERVEAVLSWLESNPPKHIHNAHQTVNSAVRCTLMGSFHIRRKWLNYVLHFRKGMLKCQKHTVDRVYVHSMLYAALSFFLALYSLSSTWNGWPCLMGEPARDPARDPALEPPQKPWETKLSYPELSIQTLPVYLHWTLQISVLKGTALNMLLALETLLLGWGPSFLLRTFFAWSCSLQSKKENSKATSTAKVLSQVLSLLR